MEGDRMENADEVIAYILGTVQGTLGSIDQSPEHKDEALKRIEEVIIKYRGEG